MDRWETPPYFFEKLQIYIKNAFPLHYSLHEKVFTLDPAASNQNHLCKQYYTYKENGLIQDWKGETVFVNPPYSDIKEWVKKCYMEGQKYNTLVALLIPARTDTFFWHDYCMKAERILFCKGRVNFLIDGKKPKNGSTFPSVVVIFKQTAYPPTITSFKHKEKEFF